MTKNESSTSGYLRAVKVKECVMLVLLVMLHPFNQMGKDGSGRGGGKEREGWGWGGVELEGRGGR